MSERGKVTENAASALNEAKATTQAVQTLRRQMSRQRAVTRAMWEIMKEKAGVTDETLRARFAESLKAQKERQAALCEVCGRPLQEEGTICVYCGRVTEGRDLF